MFFIVDCVLVKYVVEVVLNVVECELFVVIEMFMNFECVVVLL